MNGADWLLDALREEGVRHLFGNPGSTELPLLDALGRHDAPRFVLGLQESVVMGMADGYAQAGGRLGAVNVHVQPGLANAMSGILNAARARVPVLVTVGQQHQALLPSEPFLGGPLVPLGATLAKGAWEVARAADLPRLMRLAVRTALTPPCGPVVLSLPLDVQVAVAPPPHLGERRPAAPPPPPGTLDRAAAVLAAARAPVVIAGDGVAHAGAGDTVAALAERLGAPILGEPTAARVPLPTDHRLWRGPLPPFGSEIADALLGHDVVLAVGMPVFRLFGVSPSAGLPPGARLVHLDVDAREIGKVHAVAAGLVGDPRRGVEGLLARLGAPDVESRARAAAVAAGVADRRRAARRSLARAAAAPALTAAALCRAVADVVGRRDLVVDEALTSGRPLRAALGRRVPGTWLAHRGSALGWGLPAAVGAALADTGRRVMCLQGDGSLLFGAPALWTAARERLPLALVVADNGGYEILRAGLEGLTGRGDGPWPGLSLGAPAIDIAGLCGAYGASTARVEHPSELPDAMRNLQARAAEGPAVLVVRVSGRAAPVGYPVPPS